MQLLPFILIISLTSMASLLCAQNPAAAEADLDRKANEERFNMLNARVASLSESQELLVKRLSTLEQRHKELSKEIEKLKEETGRLSARHATKDELRTLAGKLQEIDRKREADKKLILESIKGLAPPPATAPPSAKPGKPTPKKN